MADSTLVNMLPTAINLGSYITPNTTNFKFSSIQCYQTHKNMIHIEALIISNTKYEYVSNLEIADAKSLLTHLGAKSFSMGNGVASLAYMSGTSNWSSVPVTSPSSCYISNDSTGYKIKYQGLTGPPDAIAIRFHLELLINY